MPDVRDLKFSRRSSWQLTFSATYVTFFGEFIWRFEGEYCLYFQWASNPRSVLLRKDLNRQIIDVYVCMYVYKYVRMHVRLYVYMYERLYVYMYVCMYVYMYVRMHLRLYVYMYVCMYVRMYICMYVCMYISMYVLCIYVCTYVWVENGLDGLVLKSQQGRGLTFLHFQVRYEGCHCLLFSRHL